MPIPSSRLRLALHERVGALSLLATLAAVIAVLNAVELWLLPKTLRRSRAL